jgi:hypothetical protein
LAAAKDDNEGACEDERERRCDDDRTGTGGERRDLEREGGSEPR